MSYIYRPAPHCLPGTQVDNARLAAFSPHHRGADTTDAAAHSDVYWENLRVSQVVCQNFERLPAIHFFRSDGDSFGVELTECANPAPQVGLTSAHVSIFHVVRPELYPILFNGSAKCLSITWPGYQHLNWKYRLVFQHSNAVPYTVGEMAKQIADLWRGFMEAGCNEFKGPGVRLGPLFVSFDKLRLNEIYSRDGTTWHAEMSYLLPS